MSATVEASCHVCGATAIPCAELQPLPFARCTGCGLVFRLDAEVHHIYEEGTYEALQAWQYMDSDDDRRRDARVRLEWLRRCGVRGGRLVDVGAAGGAFVAEAAAAGFDASGIEPTPAFAEHARTLLGVDVRTETLEEAPLEPASLDVVTLWHVLEHLPDPVGELARVAGALRVGGVVAIEVPNYGSSLARRMGAEWTSLDPEVHVSQFTPATLCAALDRAGLRPEHVVTVPITPYLPRIARLGPRHLASRAKVAAWLRSPRGRHPHGHELLRGLGRRA